MIAVMQDYQLTFIDLALAATRCASASFTLKSGSREPLLLQRRAVQRRRGARRLGQCYAAAMQRSGVAFDMLFGPAYKGIPLVAATAVALAEPSAAPCPGPSTARKPRTTARAAWSSAGLAGRVVIVDDVITAGTAVRESIDLIRRAGAEPVACCSRSTARSAARATSAVQEVEDSAALLAAIAAYRQQYGVD
jgi:orotate phosphoribosyltransferase